MDYLGLALFAEGPTDHRFLRPVLRRLTEEICIHEGSRPIEIGDVLELHSPDRHRKERREIRILEAARDSWGAWHLLFIHSDGGGDPEEAMRNRVERARVLIRRELQGGSKATTSVIPIRETEAWALVDGDALRTIFGTSLDDTRLGLPERVLEVESIPDPKRSLLESYNAGRSRRRRRGHDAVSALLEPLGELVALQKLRQLPAFQRVERDLCEALRELRFLESPPPAR